MKLTLNNKENIENLVCFNTTPNIITVDNSGKSKGKAHLTINTSAFTLSDTSKRAEIKINGYIITSTDDPTECKGRKFYSNNPKNAKFCALSICNALKNIPQLTMNYNITYDGNTTVKIQAKQSGIRYNITASSYNTNLTFTAMNGSSDDELAGQYFSEVYCDLFVNTLDGQPEINSNATTSIHTQLASLKKEYYNDSLSFNVTPVLAAHTDYGRTIWWKAHLYAAVDGEVVEIGEVKDNFMTKGYLVNQGGTYLDCNGIEGQTIPALNVKRGEERNVFNNSLLYIYEPSFDVSLYKNGQTTENVTIQYLESDETEISTSTTTLTLNKKNLDTYTITLDEDLLRDSYFIDLQFSFGTIRLNVINPPHSQVENNRVYWYNSYGGVSHFDFVGDKSEERKTELQTYKKSNLDYYVADKQEQEIVYFRENGMTVSLTTHLMEKDGLWQLYDLNNSYKAWITINGVPYYIIVESITVDEPSDNVYTATIKYKYSLLDSFA